MKGTNGYFWKINVSKNVLFAGKSAMLPISGRMKSAGNVVMCVSMISFMVHHIIHIIQDKQFETENVEYVVKLYNRIMVGTILGSIQI